MDIIFILKIVIMSFSACAILALVGVLIEIIRILSRFRKISDRIELLTDIKGWLFFFRKFYKKSKKKD